MLLRPRQKILIKRATAALEEHGNTLAIAPTGAGKTIMLSAVIGEFLKQKQGKAIVLAHRDELTFQNEDKFKKVNPKISTSVFNASTKSWDGAVTFAMVQTLSRENNLSTMPSMDLLIIDEAHHARAESYTRVIEHAKNLNSSIKILGMTATPNRGDKKGLRPIFSNVADQIFVKELIKSGHLVPPRTFVIDVGVQDQLKSTNKTSTDFDMDEVEKIMNRLPVTEAVLHHWREKAGDRQTVVFCSTVNHARNVTTAFNVKGAPAGLIHSDMSESDRKAILDSYAKGDLRVIVNVAVLTEGWDHPPTSCVILLRPSSFKSTMIQMIGRGLRIVDQTENPGKIKKDCIILDFGISTIIHGSLEQDVNLDDQVCHDEDNVKFCPACEAKVQSGTKECPLCEYVWKNEQEKVDKNTWITDFAMSEIDLLKRSNFIWIDLYENDKYYIAAGFNAWGGVFFKNGEWLAIGGKTNLAPKLLSIGERVVCFATADDWINSNESDDSAYKTKKWLNEPATDKQLKYLPEHKNDFGLTRYKAQTLLTMRFNWGGISKAIKNAKLSENNHGNEFRQTCPRP